MEIVLGLVVVLIVFALFKMVTVVPQGYAWTVESFGRYTKTLEPGLHFLIPFIQAVGRKVNMMEEVLDIPPQEVITKDNASIHADFVAFLQVHDAASASYEVNDLRRALINLTQTNARSLLGSLDLDEVLSSREVINARLLQVIDLATDPWGVKVTRVEVRDISPPQDLVDAMGRQMKAEREKRAVILEAEGQKQAAILVAEGEKQAAVLAAEAREREAQAEAKATTMLSESLATGDGKALNYLLGQQYIEEFGKLAASDNQKLVLMPMEVSGIISTIAGIADVAKDLGLGDKGVKG